MKASRTKLVAAIAFFTLAVLLGSWFRSGWQSANSEASRMRERPEISARKELGSAAEALTLRLRAMLAEEDQRPYYHYKNLFHDPTDRKEGLSVSTSPLAKSTGDLLIAAHFQIDVEGKLTIPPINEELDDLSQVEGLTKNQERLLSLRAAKSGLQEAPLVVMRDNVRKREPMLAQQIVPQRQVQQRQQVFEQQAFAQNTMANNVFQELEGKAQSVDLVDTGDKSLVKISVHPFSWRTTEIAGTKALVAMRRIDTPTGKLTQGFVVDSDELTTWLAARSSGAALPAFRHSDSKAELTAHTLAVELVNLDSWTLSTNYSSEQANASAKAAGLHSSFLWRFLPALLASLALFIMLVIVVSRAETLAHERSQFAAAAAHELRTPLAGLQLYGDMLADGLGDKDAKEKYARHIADEAQRLGRVVSNVLDFSQMEQKGLQLRPERGNLAETVRRVAERMKGAMEIAGMKLELDLPEQVFANYDDDAVYRILQNLMDNAEKYSRDHEDRTLRLTLSEEADLVQVSVSDGGPGVVSQMRQQIFKPFRRAAGDDSPAGLGLGLALARSLARQQGGNLRAEDSAFGGARFVLEVPKS